MIRITCDGCGSKYQVPDQFGGKMTKCTKCQQVLRIPLLAPAAAAPAAETSASAPAPAVAVSQPAPAAVVQAPAAAPPPVAVAAAPPPPPVQTIPQAQPSKSHALLYVLIGVGVAVIGLLAAGGWYVVSYLPESNKIEMFQARIASAKSAAQGVPDESKPLTEQDPTAVAEARDRLVKAQAMHDELLKDMQNLGLKSGRAGAVQKDLQASRESIAAKITAIDESLWPAPGTFEEMFKRVTPSVPQVLVPGVGSGSGLVFEHKGRWFVATNRHVVVGGKDGVVLNFNVGDDPDNRKPLEIKRPRVAIEYIHRFSDVAVIALDNDNVATLKQAHVRPLPLANPDVLPTNGEECWVVGHPAVEGMGIMKNTFGAGHVSNKASVGDEFSECIQIDAPINHGNSGGPLFNKLGRVIGQVTFSKPTSSMGDATDRQNFAVNVEMLLGLLDKDFNAGREEIDRILAPAEKLAVEYDRVVKEMAAKGFKPHALPNGKMTDYGVVLGARRHEVELQVDQAKPYVVAVITPETNTLHVQLFSENEQVLPSIQKDHAVDLEMDLNPTRAPEKWFVYMVNEHQTRPAPTIVAMFEKG